MTPYVFKLALKNDDGGDRKKSPLDGASCLSQRSLFQPGKWMRYNEGMFYPLTIGVEVLLGHFRDMCFIKLCIKLFLNYVLVKVVNLTLQIMNHHSHMYKAVLDYENCLELFLCHDNLGDQ